MPRGFSFNLDCLLLVTNVFVYNKKKNICFFKIIYFKFNLERKKIINNLQLIIFSGETSIGSVDLVSTQIFQKPLKDNI